MREGRDVWLPLELDAVGSSDYASGNLTFLGRLRPGVTLAQSNGELETLSAGRGRTLPSDDVSRTKLQGRLLQDAQQDTYRDAREMLLILLGAVGLLLAIAVANVASLQLVQVAGRMRDISIRLGLGATRGRVLRQLLTESLLLSLLGGAAGVIAAFLCRGALAAGAARVLPRARRRAWTPLCWLSPSCSPLRQAWPRECSWCGAWVG